MYIFTRTAQLAPGKTRAAMAWAVGITEQVNKVTELDVSLWTPVFSRAIGRLVWSTIVESLTQLEAAEAKLLAEDRYITEVDRGAEFTTDGIDDALASLVRFNPDPNRRPQYVAVVDATVAPGSFGRAIEVGVEIADRATRVSGLETTFAAGVTGAYGGVVWITGATSLDELQAGENAINGDQDFVAYLDREAANVFLPGSSEQTILRRIA